MENVSLERAELSHRFLNQLGYGLLLLMPIVSLVNILSIGKLGDLNIRPSDVVFVVTGMVWILHTGIRLQALRYEFGLLLCISLLIVLTGFASSIIPGYVVDWPRWIRFIQTMMWGVYALAFIRTSGGWVGFTNCVALSGSIIGASSLALQIINPELHRIAGFISTSAGEEFDEQLSFNEIGAVHALVAVLMLGRIFGNRMSNFAWAALILNVLGLIFTQSRSSYLAVIVFICVYVALALLYGAMNMRLRKGTLLAIVVLVFLVLAITISGKYLALDRLEGISGGFRDESTVIRLSLWSLALKILGEADIWSLLFGYGSKTLPNLIGGPTLDSFYLDHLLSEGVIGLGVIFLILFSPLALGNAEGRRNHNLALWGVATVALVVSLTGNVLVNPFYGAVTMVILWGAISSTSTPRV